MNHGLPTGLQQPQRKACYDFVFGSIRATINLKFDYHHQGWQSGTLRLLVPFIVFVR